MKLSSGVILVTGGAGFIGSHLLDALTDVHVRVIDDFSTGRMENILHHQGSSNIDIIRGDIRDRALVARALQGVRVVFHLACRSLRHCLGCPQENHDVNATGTMVLLEEARKAGVTRFIYVSSSEVYGTAQYVPMDENHPTFPETVYGAGKLAGECYVRAFYRTYGFPTVVVRPFNNFGPRSHFEGDSGEAIPRFIAWALNGQAPVVFGDGLQTRDYMYVEDTAYWLRRIAACDEVVGKTINLGSGCETSIIELVRRVYELLNGHVIDPVFMAPRPGDVRRHLADVSRAKTLLGFQPRVPFAEGLRRTVAWFQNHPDGANALLKRIDPINWKLA